MMATNYNFNLNGEPGSGLIAPMFLGHGDSPENFLFSPSVEIEHDNIISYQRFHIRRAFERRPAFLSDETVDHPTFQLYCVPSF